jgi:hypothetical protein
VVNFEKGAIDLLPKKNCLKIKGAQIKNSFLTENPPTSHLLKERREHLRELKKNNSPISKFKKSDFLEKSDF